MSRTFKEVQPENIYCTFFKAGVLKFDKFNDTKEEQFVNI